MTVVRSCLVLLLSLGLVACDADREKDQPQQPEPPAATLPQSTAPATDTPPAPAPAPLPPAGETAPPAPPPVPPAPSALPEPPSKPLERARPPAAEAAVSARPKLAEPAAPLDLSLPSETPEGFGLATGSEALPGEPQALLPPLFESKGESNSFELGGRLITNEPGQADEDSWHSVEGAELQLQFRR